MSEISSIELTAGTAIVATAVSMFACCLPGLHDVLQDNSSTGMRETLNFGQSTAAIATTSIGVVLSVFTKSLMPTIFALGISALLWFVYEFAFRRVIA
jgi:hypothetical protein